MMLTACITIQPTVIDTSCAVFEPIGYQCVGPVSDEDGILLECGVGDTAQTTMEIRKHNAKLESLNCRNN